MLHTAEIRWFMPGILTEKTLNWFSAGRPLETATVQVHEYLLFPGCDTVGVKFREDRLEIKAKAGLSQPLSPRTGVRGLREQWIKWSLPTKGLPMFGGLLRQSGPWLKVRKERNQRIFSAETGNLQEIPIGVFPVAGCNIELTRLEVEAHPSVWFTLGFEAYGPPAITARILEKGLSFFFERRGPAPGMKLNKANSCGYPAWLMNLGIT